MANPFAPPADPVLERGICGDARLISSGFLFRRIELDTSAGPASRHHGTVDRLEIRYSGWWFLQRIWINGELVWRRVSWLRIWPQVEFRLPASIDSRQEVGRIEINFSRGLMIRRFRVWIAGELIYDEVTR